MADQKSHKRTKLAMFRQIVQTLLKCNFILCNGSIQYIVDVHVHIRKLQHDFVGYRARYGMTMTSHDLLPYSMQNSGKEPGTIPNQPNFSTQN